VGLQDTLSETPAPAAATETATDSVESGSVSLDQLISEAAASTDQSDSEQPSAAETSDQPVAETAAAASVEGTSTEQPAAEPAKEPAVDDAVSVRRARSILAEANKKEQAARQAIVNAEQDLVKQLLTNPRNFLAKHGKSIAELIDIDLGQEHDPVADTAKSKPEDDRIAKLEKMLLEREQREQQAKLDSIKDSIRGNVAKDSRFELINRSRSTETVLEFMEEYWNTHGAAIPWDKAARLVEDDLRDRFGYKPAAAPAAAPTKVPQRETTAPSKPATGNTTLTNNEIRSAGPPDDSEPTDPDQLIKWLVAKEEKRLDKQAQ